MSAQTLTFPCPFCGRRMGVGIELLGKNVRCPHCKQVVLAPATSGGAAAQAPAAAPKVQTVPAKPSAAESAPAPVKAMPAKTAPSAPPPVPVTEAPGDNPFDFDFGGASPPAPAAPPPPPPKIAPTAPAKLSVTSRPPEPLELEALPQDDSLPTFKVSRKEAADSILSEADESEDEIFGQGGRAPIPTLPELPPPVAPAPAPVAVQPVPGYPQPVAVYPQPVAVTPPAAAYPQPVVVPVLQQPVPVYPQTVLPQPVPMPVMAAATAADGDNPFSFDADAAPAPVPVPPQPRRAAPQPVPVAATPVAAPKPTPASTSSAEPIAELPEEEPAPKRRDKPKPEGRRQPAAASSGINSGLFFGVVGYAVVMTGLALYGLVFKSGDKIDPGHPLSTIPDSFGEFDPVSRKKVSYYKLEGELPDNLKAPLGSKIEVGQLEIVPVKVELRPLKIVTEGSSEKRADSRPEKALVLHVRIKNTSPDLSIYPMDPALTRKARSEDKQPQPTRLVVGKSTVFFGGAIDWPFPAKVKRRYEAEQEADATPLKPDETRDYVVFTDRDPKLEAALKDANESLLWRVNVRRGLITFKGKDLPVTAIIGVEFKAGDVKIEG